MFFAYCIIPAARKLFNGLCPLYLKRLDASPFTSQFTSFPSGNNTLKGLVVAPSNNVVSVCSSLFLSFVMEYTPYTNKKKQQVATTS